MNAPTDKSSPDQLRAAILRRWVIPFRAGALTRRWPWMADTLGGRDRVQLAACALLFAGGATADFRVLAVYRSLQLSDVFIVGAGLMCAPVLFRRLAASDLPTPRTRRMLAGMLALALAYLASTALSSAIAGPTWDAADTWLLFALLMLGIAPAVTVSTATRDGALWLVGGLLVGAFIGIAGMIGQVLSSVPLYGARLDGLFRSDPYFLIIAACGIVLAHLAREVQVRELRRRGVLAAHALFLILAVVALGYSRSRSSWVSLAVLGVAAAVVLAPGKRIVAITALSLALAGFAAYELSVLPGPIEARITQTLSVDDPATQQRLEVIDVLMSEWVHQPWGVGLNESSSYVPAYLVVGHTGQIHHVVLHALVEGGPLAALAILLFPFLLTAFLRRHGPDAREHAEWLYAWPVPVVWALFASGQFTPSLYQHTAWICIGAAMGGVLRTELGRSAENSRAGHQRTDAD